MKILIVKVSALGDVVHALPVLPYVHSIYPDCEVDWLVEESFVPLLEGHQLINDVIVLHTKKWRKLPFLKMLQEFLAFVKCLRHKRYDYVFDIQGNSKSGLFTLLSKGRYKYGFDRSQVREWPNLLATNYKVSLAPSQRHVIQRSLAVVRAAFPDGDSSNPPDVGALLPVQPAAAAQVKRQLSQLNPGSAKLVVLHYGTTWKTKLWSLANWQQLAVKLVEQGDVVPLLTWGNNAEYQAATAIAEATEGKAVIWPRGTLPELVALLDRVNLVVGCDTGPIHIAAAVGTPTVSIFRVTDAQRNAPVGENHRFLQAPLSCSPCLRKECEKDAQCSVSICAADVYQTIKELMN